MTDPVIAEAVKIRDRVRSAGQEFRRRTDGLRELNEIDAKSCDEAADMLQKLGTEVTRLRLAIGCYRDYRMNRSDLSHVADTWNEG